MFRKYLPKYLISLLFLLPIVTLADTVAVPNEFASGNTISSAEMNANFKALADESNENDSRISQLESVASSVRPVWVDATGAVVGSYTGSPYSLLIKYPDSDLVYSLLSEGSINGVVQTFQGSTLYWTERGCTGSPLFGNFAAGGGDLRLRNHRSVIRAGATTSGMAVYPDFSAELVTGPVADTVAQSRSEIGNSGEVTCITQNFDYSGQAWVPGVVSDSTLWNLGISLPVNLIWK